MSDSYIILIYILSARTEQMYNVCHGYYKHDLAIDESTSYFAQTYAFSQGVVYGHYNFIWPAGKASGKNKTLHQCWFRGAALHFMQTTFPSMDQLHILHKHSSTQRVANDDGYVSLDPESDQSDCIYLTRSTGNIDVEPMFVWCPENPTRGTWWQSCTCRPHTSGGANCLYLEHWYSTFVVVYCPLLDPRNKSTFYGPHE